MCKSAYLSKKTNEDVCQEPKNGTVYLLGTKNHHFECDDYRVPRPICEGIIARFTLSLFKNYQTLNAVE